MGCKFNNCEGMCEHWDGVDSFEHITNSCDDDGYCLVDEDEDPSISCEDYEEN